MNWMVAILCVVLFGMTLYYLATCSETTREERERIYESLRMRPYANEAWEDFDRVSFDRHLWRVATLRDPRDLYGHEIASIMGWKL